MSEEKFTGELKTGKYEQSTKRVEKTYLVIFKENRRTELKIGRDVIIFMPWQINELTESQINHPDFKQQESCFSVREK